ncbi:hypothetical protein VPH35_090791 [Triticum aestivum]
MSWSDLPADLLAGITDRMSEPNMANPNALRAQCESLSLLGSFMWMRAPYTHGSFLSLPAHTLSEHADLARLRSVCPSWRSASAVHAARRCSSCPPNTSPIVVKISVPAARGSSFLSASPQGWALAVDSDFSATLLHPFTGASASLPALLRSLSLSVNFIVRDMVWDRSPHAVMMARTGRQEQARWSARSITYCDGVFHLFDGETRRTVGLDSETFAVAAVIQPPVMLMPEHLRRGAPWNRRRAESTLVVSPGDLLVIVRTHLLLPGASDGSRELFKAFRCRLGRRSRIPTRWSEVDDIGDRAVFVDSFRGFFVEANGVNGVRRNCMYVASSCQDADGDSRYAVSALDLARLTTERLSLGNLGSRRCDGGFREWPSWSMPNLQPCTGPKSKQNSALPWRQGSRNKGSFLGEE